MIATALLWSFCLNTVSILGAKDEMLYIIYLEIMEYHSLILSQWLGCSPGGKGLAKKNLLTILHPRQKWSWLPLFLAYSNRILRSLTKYHFSP